MYQRNKNLTHNSQELRKNMTPQEKRLWYDFLKKPPITARRQYNIENYIVDFYIPEKKLVIEIDGEQHYKQEHKTEDKKRDENLKGKGITVLRYDNRDIDRNFDGVCNYLIQFLGFEYSELKR